MIYLDNNATTKIDHRVYHKQCEILHKYYGNPSSLYPFGTALKDAILEARIQVARLINADMKNGDRIIFTSCATESNNSVLFSVLQPNAQGKHIIVTSVEHPSILNPISYYKSTGCNVTYIDVDSDGILNEEKLLSSITDKTVLVSIMLVNSETGVVFDIERFAKKIKAINKKTLIHTDAVQAAGKIPIDVKKLNVDFLTLSGHKFNGPKGVGVLYIKSGIPFHSMLLGGHQEFNLRAGTENTSSIIALGEAARLAFDRVNSGQINNIKVLRDSMEKQLISSFPDSLIFGKNAQRVCNTTNIGFKNVDGDKLVLQLASYNICVSSGTACDSLSAQPSNVLRQMQAPEEYIRSIRVSLSHENTKADIDYFLKILKCIINK